MVSEGLRPSNENTYEEVHEAKSVAALTLTNPIAIIYGQNILPGIN